MRASMVKPAQRRQRAEIATVDAGLAGCAARPAKEQLRAAVLTTQQPEQIAVAARRADAGQLRQRVDEEVPAVPQRSAEAPRALPVDRCEAFTIDHDVPGAEVVVLEDRVEERLVGYADRRLLPDLLQPSPLIGGPLARCAGGGCDLEQPAEDVLDQSQLVTLAAGAAERRIEAPSEARALDRGGSPVDVDHGSRLRRVVADDRADGTRDSQRSLLCAERCVVAAYARELEDPAGSCLARAKEEEHAAGKRVARAAEEEPPEALDVQVPLGGRHEKRRRAAAAADGDDVQERWDDAVPEEPRCAVAAQLLWPGR